MPTIHAPNPNPTQAHALVLATFAGELLEVFDELELGLDSDARGDGLKSTREALLSVATRVIQPLVSGIMAELVLLIEALETPAPTCTPKPATYSKMVNTQHPSILALQSIMPIYVRALARYFPTTSIQSHLASLEISVVWRALVALPQRTPSHLTPPSSPNLALVGINGKKGRAVGTTPPTTPPSTRFHLKLPPSILPPLRFPKRSCHLPSVTPELYATCFAHYPEPMLIKRPHVQHERPSVTLAMDSRLSCV